MITILRPGIKSVWTDAGRINAQANGFSQAGAIDTVSFMLANAVLGKQLTKPSIEVMAGQFSLTTNCAVWVCICGAPCNIFINDSEIRLNQAYLLQAQDILKIDNLTTGLFNYVAFSADYKLPLFKGSVCAVHREQSGGINGDGVGLNANEKFDELENRNNNGCVSLHELSTSQLSLILSPKLSPAIKKIQNQINNKVKEIPIVFAYQQHEFGVLQQARFLASSYTISQQIDKMGIRLNGPKIIAKSTNLRSQALANGAIQIAGDGQPIIMRNERQTIGGYPVIAVVSSIGLTLLSQALAKQTINFVSTDFENATLDSKLIYQFLLKLSTNQSLVFANKH